MSKKNSQVYVSRFARSTSEEDLNDNFKQFGKIREISMKNGYAFLEFEDYHDAEEAVDRMDGKSVDGHKLIVEMAGANKKGKRSGRGRGPQPGDKCFNCGKTGHWANECRESRGRRRRSSSSRSRSDSKSSSSSRDRKKKSKNNKKSNKRSRSRSESRSKSSRRSDSSRSRSRSDSSKSKRSKSSDKPKKKNNGDSKKIDEENKATKEEETNKEKDH